MKKLSIVILIHFFLVNSLFADQGNYCTAVILPEGSGTHCTINSILTDELKDTLLSGDGIVDVYVLIDGEMGVMCRKIVEGTSVESVTLYPPLNKSACVTFRVPIDTGEGFSCDLGKLFAYPKKSIEEEVCAELLS